MSELIELIAALPNRPRFSDSGNWIPCPAKLTIPDPQPSRTNTAAQIGTMAHSLSEFTLNLGVAPSIAVKSVAPMLDSEERNEMVEHVTAYVEYVQAIKGKRYIEYNVKLPELGIDGTADTVIWDDENRELHIIDLKYGMQKVDVENNSQFMSYGYAAMKQLDIDPAIVFLHVFQPRIDNVNMWGASKTRLADHYAKMVAALEDAVSGKPTYRANPEGQCKWCHAKAGCPKLKAINAKLVKLALMQEDPSREARQEILANAPVVRMFLDAVEKAEIEDLQNGAEPINYVLVPKRPSKKWKLTAQELVDRFGEDILKTPDPITPTQAIKQFGAEKVKDLYEEKSSGVNLKAKQQKG